MCKIPPVSRLAASWMVVCLTVAASSGDDSVPRWSSRVIGMTDAQRGRRDRPVVTALSIHPTGRLLATAGDDHRVLVWTMADGNLEQQLEGHRDWVRAVAYSPDGRRLATAGNDRRIVMWDAEDGQQRHILAEHPRPISALQYSPDGRYLATIGFEDSLYIYEVATGDQIYRLDCPCQDMRSIAFSPDGKIVAAGGRNGKIRLWSINEGTVIRQNVVHRQRIRDLAFSHDGRHLASCGDDRIVNVMNVETGTSIQLPSRPCKVFALAFVDDERLATAGSDNEIRIWNLVRRVENVRLTGHTGTISKLIDHDGLLISGSYDTTVRVWTEGNNVAGEQPRPIRRVGRSEFRLD